MLASSSFSFAGAHIARPGQNTHILTSRRKENGFYEGTFDRIQAFQVQLHSLRTDAESISPESDAQNTIIEQADILINSRYMTLISNCESVVMTLQQLIEDCDIDAVTRIAKDLLFCAVNISKSLTNQKFTFQKPRPRHRNSLMPGDMKSDVLQEMSLSNSIPNGLKNVTQGASAQSEDAISENMSCGSECEPSEEELVVCRICDEKVPLDLIEEHMRSCVEANKNATLLVRIHEEMTSLMREVRMDSLNVKWPGMRRLAATCLLPLTRMVYFLEKALSVDVQREDASDELQMIEKQIRNCKTGSIPHTALEYFNRLEPLLRQKLTASKAIYNAETILRSTTVGGDRMVKTASQTNLSDFVFLKSISSGAYARVFLARKKKTGDVFAVKVIPKSSLQQKNQVKRVLAEKDILLKFSNPYIVNFYYSVIGAHNLYLFMEFLPGGDLYSLLQRFGSLDEDTTKYYMFQVLMALKFLHANGIIHRDLKPENILVSASGHVKLTDFGLSHLGVSDRRITEAGLVRSQSFVGTPDYIAPEIILNRSHTFSCDYWAFGILIYECLTGLPPFHAETEEETHRNILTGTFGFDEDVEISKEAMDIIRQLLTKNQDERLGSRDIEDIFNHPWFKGYDISTQKPPFIPELKGEIDTDYFEQRYQFVHKDETDILEDIKLQNEMSLGERAKDTNIRDFESVSLDSLAKATREAAGRRRSASFVNTSTRTLAPEPKEEQTPTFTHERRASFTNLEEVQSGLNRNVPQFRRILPVVNCQAPKGLRHGRSGDGTPRIAMRICKH